MNSKVLLRPFSLLYGGITKVRNWLYNKGLYGSYSPDVFTVSVGNLTVGGTGKTPMVEYLIRELSPEFRIATLSRGYGRKTKGFRLAGETATAEEIGDEPLQYYKKFNDQIQVTVCEKRVEGYQQIRNLFPEVSLVLLDDAYQHRPIAPHFNILLNDFNRPFYEDHPFPEGYLRENRSGAVRADVVIVTKCPSGLSEEIKLDIVDKISAYTKPNTPVYFASVKYGHPHSYGAKEVETISKVVAMAGIAQPGPFFEYGRSRYEVEEEVVFADHYNFTEEDLDNILKCAKNGTFVLTTEKDMVKLKPLTDSRKVSDRFAYLPIEMDLGDDSSELISLLERRHKAVKKG